MMSKDIAIIIVAAGNGSRFGSELPKQYCQLGGRPVVMHSIERFRLFLPDARIVLVLSEDRIDFWKNLCREQGFISPQVVSGGKTRWESVKNALESLDQEVKTVMVHDGARPLVSRDVLCRLIDCLDKGAEGALPVIPLTDSIRQLNPDGSSNAVDRSRYVAVQTPQAFPLHLLKESYRQPYCGTMTDDASVMEAAGHFDIRLVEGDEATLKITRPADILIAGLYLDR